MGALVLVMIMVKFMVKIMVMVVRRKPIIIVYRRFQVGCPKSRCMHALWTNNLKYSLSYV